MNVEKICIAFTDEKICRAYSLILKTPLNSINVFTNYQEATKHIHRARPSLIMCDPFLTVDGIRGLDFMDSIKNFFHKAKILAITDCYTEQSIIDAFKAGASGYILRQGGIEEVLKAVNDMLQGGAPLSREVASCLINSYQISRDNPLSKREREILRAITTGLTYNYIADQLHVSVDTVRTHVQHIFEKLNVSNKSEAVIKARLNRLV